MNRMKILAMAVTVCVVAGSVAAQQPGDARLEGLVARASGALARLHYTIANELMGRQRRIGLCICIDAKRGTFVTSDVPVGVPIDEMVDFTLTPPGSQGNEFQTELLGTDPEEGLTFLKLALKTNQRHPWAALSFSPSAGLKLGQQVVSVGLLEPGVGNVPYVGMAVIGAKLRLPDEVLFVTAGDLTVASSPVMAMDGRVIGMVRGQMPMSVQLLLGGRWADTRMRGLQSTRFFIPTNEFAHVISSIPTPGRPRKLPWLGEVSFQPVPADDPLEKQLAGRPAALIGQLLPGSPATKVGLKQGDPVIALDGKPLEALPTSQLVASNFRRKLLRHSPGSTAKLTVLRKGKPETFVVQLAERPPLPNEAPRYYNGALGMAARELVVWDRYAGRAKPLPDTINGMAVTAIRQKSPAASGQLRPNDLILTVNEKAVKDVAGIKAVLDPISTGSSPITFLVLRGETKQVVVVNPKSQTAPK